MAEKAKLYMVREDDDGGPEWLSRHPEGRATCREATEEDLAAGVIADYLDDQAEGDNYHDFVPLHSRLAGLLEVAGGPGAARIVMRAILDRGGLHRMARS
jgi:hypothetical protein